MSKIITFPIGHVIVSLVVLSQSSILASASNVTNKTNALAEIVLSSMHVPWMDGIKSVTITPPESFCTKEIEAFKAAFDARENWALEMQDASSKILSGILWGNVADLGMYEQCVRVDGTYEDVHIRGRHCMVKFGSELIELTFSVCLPASCDETHALRIADSAIESFSENRSLKVEIEAISASCALVESEDFSVGEMLTIAFFSAVACFMVFCTICDSLQRTRPHRSSSTGAMKILLKFSLYKNARALVDTRVKVGSMPAINGIRFFSTCWIVAMHDKVATADLLLLQPSDYVLWMTSWGALWRQTATFATDNFFIISGFFTSFLFFKKIQRDGQFSVPMMYLHRYLRLTPGIIVVGLFLGNLYHRIGDGPIWKAQYPRESEACSRNWWINFLYIQNFLSTKNICYAPSWFLAADMQLFLLTPIILYPLHCRPKFGICLWLVFIFASIVVPTLIVGLNGYSIDGFNSIPSAENYYIRPYARPAFPYLLGVFLGYEIATKKRRFGKLTIAFNWTVTCLLITLCCLAMRRMKTTDYDLAFVTTCAALLRPSWAIAMAWIIYACTHGHGGIATKVFSLPIFVPLSRISFGVYLLHGLVIVYGTDTARMLRVFIDSNFLAHYLGNLVLTILLATVINLFFETPVLILENILTTNYRKRNETTAAQDVLMRGTEEEAENQTEHQLKSEVSSKC